MKKILLIFLVTLLVLTACACGKANDTSSLDSTPFVGEDAQFIKPENYATVMVITINPTFRLYLGSDNTVLAVEPVNDDAKSVTKDITFEPTSVETIVEKLVTESSQKGFVKENATVQVEITEKKLDTIDTEQILQKAKTAVDTTATELKLAVAVTTEDKTELTNSDTQSQTSSQAVSSKPTPATSAITSVNIHTHKFADATCTEPKKCECGATDGKALGHNYKNGLCSVCEATDPNFVSFKSVKSKNGYWMFKYVTGETFFDASLNFVSGEQDPGISFAIGDSFSKLPEEAWADIRAEGGESYVTFEGGEYYVGRGGGDDIGGVTEDQNIVTVTDLAGNKLVLERTGENTLKVKTAPAQFSDLENIPQGTVLTFAE